MKILDLSFDDRDFLNSAAIAGRGTLVSTSVDVKAGVVVDTGVYFSLDGNNVSFSRFVKYGAAAAAAGAVAAAVSDSDYTFVSTVTNVGIYIG